MNKESIFGKTLSELQKITESLGLPKFTAKQIAQWLYEKRASSFEEMTNLSKDARQKLNDNYQIGITTPFRQQVSVDGTKKYLFPTSKNLFVEAAYIPEETRKTLCISSQVGCKMGCLFCMTGKQGFQSQLTAGEILNQVRSIEESELLTNIVFMGMGEPMDNIEEVLKTIEILTSDWGYKWSPRRITVSTIGVVPAMKRFIEQSEAHLAISLHTPFDEERRKLMPIQQVYSIENVVEALKEYDFGRQRRISFEYIVFEGVNDTEAHAKGIVKLLNGLKYRVNLIKFHPIPDSPLKGTSQEKMQWFSDQLRKKGVVSTVRRSRGEDIYAACGLLSTKELVKNKEEKDY